MFTKDKIKWNCTIVKFRNGVLGLAVTDKINAQDFDGIAGFMLWDTATKCFYGIKSLDCFTDNLTCKTSLKGILSRIDVVINQAKPATIEDTNRVSLCDPDWDVVGVLIYPYAVNAYKRITCTEEIKYWTYNINTERTVNMSVNRVEKAVDGARWKGAGLGDYYCSYCMEEVTGNTLTECPNCHSEMDVIVTNVLQETSSE